MTKSEKKAAITKLLPWMLKQSDEDLKRIQRYDLEQIRKDAANSALQRRALGMVKGAPKARANKAVGLPFCARPSFGKRIVRMFRKGLHGDRSWINEVDNLPPIEPFPPLTPEEKALPAEHAAFWNDRGIR